MKQLALVLIKCRSFKDRQECLSESLSNLSFNYPEVYSLLIREVKKRELECNDPNKITRWINTTPNSYIKLHEALMLVKSHNIMAKEEYVCVIKHMLIQTIENGCNIEVALKICNLIEKSPHLKTIFERLIDLVQKVKKLNINNRHNIQMKNMSENMEKDNFKQTVIDPLQQLNKRYAAFMEQQQKYVWPTMQFPNNLKMDYSYPHFNYCYGYDQREMIASNYSKHSNLINVPQRLYNLTIIGQEMDGAVIKWLHYLKLHKYQWFFNELSYLEIEFIDEDNIEGFIVKVNKNSITKGAQKKICISTKMLRDRQQKFNDLLLAFDLAVTSNELCEHMTYMLDILHYPIPNKNCVVGDQLQQDIILIMEKSLNQIIEKLYDTNYLVANSLLGTSINKYLECTLLITSNQIFMKHQIDKIVLFTEKLKNVIYKMPKNFN